MVLRPKNKAQQVDPGVGAPYPGEKRVNFITVVDFPLSFSFLPFFRFASFSAASSADGVPKKEKKRKEERKKASKVEDPNIADSHGWAVKTEETIHTSLLDPRNFQENRLESLWGHRRVALPD